MIKAKGLQAWSFEGFIVELADEIAQRHHDIEDALHIGIVNPSEALRMIKRFFKKYFDSQDKQLFASLQRSKREIVYFIPLISKFLVNFLNKNLIQYSQHRLNEFLGFYSIRRKADFIESREIIDKENARSCISYEPGFARANDLLQAFLKNRILNSFEVQRMDGRGTYIVRKLFKAYLSNPRQLPDTAIVDAYNLCYSTDVSVVDIPRHELGHFRDEIGNLITKPDLKFQVACLRAICDYIAGMTDNFAFEEYSRLYAQ